MDGGWFEQKRMKRVFMVNHLLDSLTYKRTTTKTYSFSEVCYVDQTTSQQSIKNQNFNKFIRSAMSLIDQSLNQMHQYVGILIAIWELLRRPWEAQVVHTLREGNYCADALAKMGIHQREHLQVLDQPPAALRLLLLADEWRVSYPEAWIRVPACVFFSVFCLLTFPLFSICYQKIKAF